MGGASNLQGLASNTIWRGTIQFAGAREGEQEEEEEEGGEQMRDRSREVRNRVRGHRQRMKPASNVHGARRCRETH